MFKISEEEIRELFYELQTKTDNFKNIESQLFFQNPRRILIIRLIFGMSLKQFARFTDTSFQALSNWELNKKTPAKWKIAKVLNKIIPEIQKINDISIKEVLKNFKKFKKMSEGLFKNPEVLKLLNENRSWIMRQKYSINASKFRQRTNEEAEISKILSDKKMEFYEQHPIINAGSSKAGYLLSDFYVISENANFIIETFRLNGKHRIQSSIIQALKSYRIKKVFPDIKTICAVKTNETEHKSMYILKEAFDFVVINDFLTIPQLIVKNKKSAEDGNSRAQSSFEPICP